MIQVGIIGATGYAGGELVRLLYGHKDVEIKWYGSRSYVDQKYASVYQNMFQIVEDVCKDDNLKQLAKEVDVIFTATPQGFLAGVLDEEILSNTKVIDLSADFRIKDVATYEKWYGIQHKSPQFIPEAVYGLCERNREAIKQARLVANPGCYPTCSITSIFPLAAEGLIDMNTLIIDAKSGTSGAGRSAKVANLYCEVNENIKAYGVASHRHTPEIEQTLSKLAGQDATITFVPHLLPVNRGILSTIYAHLKDGVTEQQLRDAAGCPVVLNFTPHLVPMNRGILVTAYASLKEVKKPDGSLGLPDAAMIRAAYDKYYQDEKFVRVLPEGVCPETKWVEGSNFVDVNVKVDPRTKRVIMMGAMDNLVKGAAGQAVQNMNLMFGLEESEGLDLVPMFP